MKKIMRILGIICIIFALLFFADTLSWEAKYEYGKEEYKKLKDNVISSSDTDNALKIDWEKLKSENPDIVAWIVMDPDISYPVVQAEDNSFYLHNGFQKEKNINGCIFMSAYNSADFSDKNTIIYGHNMRNGQMFGNNDLYTSKDFVKEHPYFYIYTEKGRMTYTIFDTMTVPDSSRPYTYTFYSNEFADYLNEMKELASYTIPEVWPKSTDQIVTLSTCTAHGSLRFLIQGVLSSFNTS